MKNIHVLPTDKPSRLFEILQFNFVFDNQNKYSEEYKKLHKYKNQNIYITSDEEIEEGDWVIYEGNLVPKKIIKVYITESNDQLITKENLYYNKSFCKKIILTTDQELIKDGVQAIDDEFLEWFVKNPSCEEVDVEKWTDYKLENYKDVPFFKYKIIIPKEEPQRGITITHVGKKETLLEIANKKLMSNDWLNGAEFGAKWQQEQICNHNYILTDEQGHRVIKCDKCNHTQPI